MKYKIKINRQEIESIIYVLNVFLNGEHLEIHDEVKFRELRNYFLLVSTPVTKVYEVTLTEDQMFFIWISIKTALEDKLIIDEGRVTQIIPIMTLFAATLDHIREEKKDE